MNKVIVDQGLRSRLNGLDAQVEFCEDTGQTLGYFVPADVYKEMLFAWADSHLSEEELEQRRQEPGGRTLAEIWQRLGAQ